MGVSSFISVSVEAMQLCTWQNELLADTHHQANMLHIALLVFDVNWIVYFQNLKQKLNSLTLAL